MPWRFMPRVGPFVRTPTRRAPSPLVQVLWALLVFAFLVLMIVAVVKGAA